MTNLITEARELIESLHDGRWEHERIDYCAYEKLNGICDALEKANEKNERLVRELSQFAIESVKREKELAKLEAETIAAMGRRGTWEKKHAGHYRCSVCGQVEWDPGVCKFCCNCGARMEMEE